MIIHAKSGYRPNILDEIQTPSDFTPKLGGMAIHGGII
jgi:hypothetical protein